MINQLLSINWLAVLLCGIAFMVVGFAWYSIFAKPWSELTGWTREKVSQLPQSRMATSYGLTFVTALLSAFVLAGVMHLTKTTTIPRALGIAGVVWAGFTAAPTASNFLFEQRPLRLWLIVTGNTLVSLLISAVILAVLK